jgi:hypothetical protein
MSHPKCNITVSEIHLFSHNLRKKGNAFINTQKDLNDVKSNNLCYY